MIRKITKDRPLKILSFTDMHLDWDEGQRIATLKAFRETIETEKPDLVTMVGDNVVGHAGEERTRALAALMTELKMPWAPVLGNHEGDMEGRVPRKDGIDMFKESPYCLIPEKEPVLEDGTVVWGNANYSVPLYNDKGEICFRLIFMDGGSHATDEDLAEVGLTRVHNNEYEWLKESQIAWYKETIKNDTCPSMIFCHIPLPEYNDAFEKGEVLCGIKGERVSCASYNSGMFDAMVESGKTICYVTGHDHVNDYHALYKGIRLIYNRASGYSSYNALTKKASDKLMQGCSIYYIDYEGKISFDEVVYEDRYPQYREEVYRVIRKE